MSDTPSEESIIEFYDEKAEEYAAETLNIDLTSLYKVFEQYLLPQSRILDAGCGAGRDAAYFASRGYEVTAFDASPALSAIAERVTGLDVLVLRFDDVRFFREFDAVWANASLVHLARARFQEVLSLLVRAVVPGGILFVSLRKIVPPRVGDPRVFVPWSELQLRKVARELERVSIEELWESVDERGRASGVWINLILRKEQEGVQREDWCGAGSTPTPRPGGKA